MNEMSIRIKEATKQDIPIIHSLAHDIWPATYRETLPPAQLDYMMQLIYSEASLTRQFDLGHHFLIAEENKQPVAFASYNMLKPGVYKLQKIYSLPQEQGKGIGRSLIDYIIRSIQ